MQAGILGKLFGTAKDWRGPCTIVLDADANVQASGTDSIVNAGAKMYAPRLITGRVAADAVCYLPDDASLVVMQQFRIRQSGGQDQFQQTVLVMDANHVAAVEYNDLESLAGLGLETPPAAAALAKTRG